MIRLVERLVVFIFIFWPILIRKRRDSIIIGWINKNFLCLLSSITFAIIIIIWYDLINDLGDDELKGKSNINNKIKVNKIRYHIWFFCLFVCLTSLKCMVTNFYFIHSIEDVYLPDKKKASQFFFLYYHHHHHYYVREEKIIRKKNTIRRHVVVVMYEIFFWWWDYTTMMMNKWITWFFSVRSLLMMMIALTMDSGEFYFSKFSPYSNHYWEGFWEKTKKKMTDCKCRWDFFSASSFFSSSFQILFVVIGIIMNEMLIRQPKVFVWT